MAKKIQFWLTDEEYSLIEAPLVEACNRKGCAPSEYLKALVVEYIPKTLERNQHEPAKRDSEKTGGKIVFK